MSADLVEEHGGLKPPLPVASVHPKQLHLRTQTGAEGAAGSKSMAWEE